VLAALRDAPPHTRDPARAPHSATPRRPPPPTGTPADDSACNRTQLDTNLVG
jgi:hypothetical protein